MPKISLVVSSFNSKATLSGCLGSINKSKYKNYELIVVDDGSLDNSIEIAKKYTKKVFNQNINGGRIKARNRGFIESSGEIVVNIDSDVMIFSDTLQKIADFFDKNPKIDGITGILSKTHPNKNFASQYKNLYMNYVFNKLPGEINFFYGSVFAFRKEKLKLSGKFQARITDDTEMGQKFVKKGLKIAFLKDLEVIHLKKYTLLSLIKNDFITSFEWAKIFWKYEGWKQIGKGGVGFAHASREQVVSLFLVPLGFICPVLFIVWFLINFDFVRFMSRERGISFGIRSTVYTFFDHLIMMTGVICGSIKYFLT